MLPQSSASSPLEVGDDFFLRRDLGFDAFELAWLLRPFWPWLFARAFSANL